MNRYNTNSETCKLAILEKQFCDFNVEMNWPRRKIVQALGISEHTVKAIMQSAIKDVKKYMGIGMPVKLK